MAQRSPSWGIGDSPTPSGISNLPPKCGGCLPIARKPCRARSSWPIAATFSLDELRYEYPEELCPTGLTPIEHLSRLVWQGAQERYPDGIPHKVRGMLEYELKLVEEVRYEAYFLTVWDLVKFARGRDILCQGAARRRTRSSVTAWA